MMKRASKDITSAIYSKVKEESEIIGWKNKRSSEKKMSIAIYDILSENISIRKIKPTN